MAAAGVGGLAQDIGLFGPGLPQDDGIYDLEV